MSYYCNSVAKAALTGGGAENFSTGGKWSAIAPVAFGLQDVTRADGAGPFISCSIVSVRTSSSDGLESIRTDGREVNAPVAERSCGLGPSGGGRLPIIPNCDAR